MSSSILNPKFLLDENVKRKLFQFLINKGYDAKLVSESAKDPEISRISKTEKRILVTNDEDFIYYTSDQVTSVIWLRIPQHDTQALLTSFDKMLKEVKIFSGKLVVLYENKWDQFPLGEELKLEGEFRAIVWRKK